MKISKTATLELANEDVLALRAIARIAETEIDRERAKGGDCTYERPGVALGFNELKDAYAFAKRIGECL